jgi:hypothetical protein
VEPQSYSRTGFAIYTAAALRRERSRTSSGPLPASQCAPFRSCLKRLGRIWIALPAVTSRQSVADADASRITASTATPWMLALLPALQLAGTSIGRLPCRSPRSLL